MERIAPGRPSSSPALVRVLLIAEADAWLRARWSAVPGASPDRIASAAAPDRIAAAVARLPPGDALLADTGPAGEDTGLALARAAREHALPVGILLAPTRSSEALAIAALRAGVDDYLRRPFDAAGLQAALARAGCRMPPGAPSRLIGDTSHRAHRGHQAGADRLVGTSPEIRQVEATITSVAPHDTTVLVLGETGTGKELVAQLLHARSPRRHRPLVAVNCAAIPDGLVESELFGHERGAFTGAHAARRGAFEEADGGTLFLDEIGDMSAFGQAKLLRTLESGAVRRLGADRERPVDVRIVAASNRDLRARVAEGAFREDLYYRLDVVRIDVPPLRERSQDVADLCMHFLARLGPRFGKRVTGFSAGALEAMLRHRWPGNVRELRNVLESVVVTTQGPLIQPEDLPRTLREQVALHGDEALDERGRLLAALYATNGNKSRAADRLRWSRMTLYRKMAKYEIARSSRRGAGPEPRPPAVPEADRRAPATAAPDALELDARG